MPWQPLPRIAFAVAIYPFQPSSPADLPLELGDELYIIEQGGANGEWYRGYLVAPPSLLAGLTSVKGQTLEARVFSGIFPKNCVEIREVLGDADGRVVENGDSVNGATVNGMNGERRHSMASSTKENISSSDSSANGFVEIKAFRKRMHVISLKSDEDTLSRPAISLRSASVPLTPRSISPRDPNAPKPAAPVPMLKIGDETPTSYEEPLVDEIASCLREWHSTNLHELLLARQYSVLESMSNVVLELDLARRQLLHDVLTAQEKVTVREETVWNLVRGNKMLTGEVIVRDPKQRGRLLTGDDSAIDLTRLQSEMSMLDSGPEQPVDAESLHHLLLEVNAISGRNSRPVTLSIYLSSKLDNGAIKPLSETFMLDAPSPEKLSTLAQSSKLKTLFTEICAADIGEGSSGKAQLYLVVMIQVNESARPRMPPKSQSFGSRDGIHISRSTSTLRSATGSIKGRRSAMKQRDDVPGKETSKVPPQSSGSSQAVTTKKEATIMRTVGVGVLDVAQILRQDKDTEQVIHTWSPLSEDDEEDNIDEDFDEIIRSLFPSSTGHYTRPLCASLLHVHLYPFVGADADALVQNDLTLMHNVTQTRRMGFPAAPAKPRSDIYLTILQAVFPQDALLSHPQAGQVPVPPSSELRSLQLTLEVRNASGARIDRCIFPCSNSCGHTAWRTTAAERGSSWSQTICLKIPTDQVPGSHVIMSVADAPEFPFALAWMPLWDQQAFLRDGSHSLLLHAYDKFTSNIDEGGRGAYLDLSWSALGKNKSAKYEALTGPLATLRVETNLCSTEYSQDQVILGLISWKEKRANEVLELLRRIVFVPEIEIVKQLRDVFDALFGILIDNAGSEEYEDLVFNDLVTVLGIVHDRRFNLEPLVDHYAEEQFNFPFATPCLIRSYLRLLQANTDSQQSRSLRAAVKVGRHLLKFIINARQQQKIKEEGIGITQIQPTFNRDLHSIFKSLEALMRDSSPVLVGSKTLIVQHFHTWLPELSNALSKDEIIMIALSFMDSCSDVKGLLVLYKLVLVQHYTRLSIFSEGLERQTLISSCIDWMEPYWGTTSSVTDQYRDQVRLCCSVAAELLNQPDSRLYGFMPKIVSSFCAIVAEGVEETGYLSMLFSKSFPFHVKASNRKQRFDEALVELAALIGAIAKIPNPKLPSLKQDDLAVFLFQILSAHKSIVTCEAYPEDWLSVHIYHHRATMRSLEYLSTILINSLLPAPDDADNFDMKLWEAFFETLLKVVSSGALALETSPEQKRRAVWKIGGDVREQGAALLRRSWEAIGWEATEEERTRYGVKRLGGYQVQYVPSLVPPIIELCLSVHEGLRHVAVEILQTMIISEWDLNQDLSIVETEIISSLDILFQNKFINESITQKLFIAELLDLFASVSDPDDELSTSVKGLIATVDELLDLLVACHSGGVTKSLHALKLMEFMKDMGREDIFIRYVHELAQTQAAARNYPEAGLALQFHADLYDWDVTKLVSALSNPPFPEQTSFERKETLYFGIIQHFEDGKAWAHALTCYKELADQYEHTILDFSKLSRAQSSMARIYDSIVKEERQFPRYFRVAYKGLGFPSSLRDKQFIFEASQSERMLTFTDRMQKQHPAAQVISSGEIKDLEGQFLHITAISVHRDVGHPVYQRSKIPPSAREHLLVSTPRQFSTTSERHTSGVDLKEQWVEKTVLTVAEPFPNILRRSEVVATEEVDFTPLQTAIERTWRKTQELLLLEQRVVSGDDPNLLGLTEALTQLLESSSTSCVASYRQFLSQRGLSEEPLEEEGEEVPKPVDPMENALAVALIDHALTIKRCVALYSRPAYQATQTELMQRLDAVFGPELASLSSVPPPQSFPRNSHQQLAIQSQSLVNGIYRDESALKRSVSPEQALIRSYSSLGNTRKHSSRKPAVGHRINIMNPFRRVNHPTINSNTSVNTLGTSDVTQHSIARASSTATDHQSLLSQRTGTIQNHADDILTVRSRTYSSRGSKSEKRRNFFGGDPRPRVAGSSVSLSRVSADDFSASQNQKSPHSHDRSVTAKSHDGFGHYNADLFSSSSNDNDLSASNDNYLSSPESPDSVDSDTALPMTIELERPMTAESYTHSASGSIKFSGAMSNSSPSPSRGVKDSIMKRLSLFRAAGRKTSRVNFRDGANGGGGISVEPLHE
ncbi:hypothetical protein Egran_03800 [Elaphomyces granulatus]|uniref:SH3 domain-containing protein n=1 Tax=Elaphomyces granulatus TaxID=519963 RepID=A0A232LX97_9EURO|nr:hypothetical protein Egran_03800 [Elaphomyces granulatus]